MLLPRKIPAAIALEMLLTGEPIDAERAAAIGLINEVVPAGTALRRALALAHRVAQNAPLAVRATKAVALQSGDWTPEQMWQRQAAITGPVLASFDAQEGGRAFLERRAPVWREA
jgi:enoyl-CoA hydratase